MDERLQRAVKERAHALTDFVVAIRRDIHAHPELGNQEQRTPTLIATAVRDLGYEVQERVGGTGVVAVLRGAHPGRTLALRADGGAVSDYSTPAGRIALSGRIRIRIQSRKWQRPPRAFCPSPLRGHPWLS